jgi:hypothetical protein
MSLYIELEPFIPYLHSLRKLESYLTLDLKFPSKWVIPKNLVDEKRTVTFEVEDTNFKGVSFVMEISSTELESTINRVSKIIKLNQEKEIKEKLFKQTVEQLKKTFEQTNLDKLQGLYFDFASEEDDDTNLDTYDTGESETTELAGE